MRDVKRQLLHKTVSDLAYLSGQSVDEWAMEHGMSYDTLHGIWCGAHEPYQYTVECISRITGLSAEQILSKEPVNEPTLRRQHRRPVVHPRLKAEVVRQAAEADMSQSRFCRMKIGMTREMVYYVWCGGKTKRETRDRICRALGREESELFD